MGDKRKHDSQGFRLWRMLFECRALVGLVMALSIITSGLALVQPVFLSQLMNSIERGTPWGRLIWAMAVLMALSACFSSVKQYAADVIAERAIRGVRDRIVDHALRVPLTSPQRPTRDEYIAGIGADASALRSAITGGMFEVFGNTLLAVGALIAMAIVDWQLLAVSLTVILLVSLMSFVTFRFTRRCSSENQEALGALTGGLDRAILGSRAIRVYGATDRVACDLMMLLRRSQKAGLKLAKMQAVFVVPVNGLAVNGTVLAVLALGGARVASGVLSVGDLVAFVAYLFLAVVPIGQLFSTMTDVGVALGIMDRFHIFSLNDELEPGARLGDPANSRQEGFGGVGDSAVPCVVKLSSVEFVHETGEFVLGPVSLTIRTGLTAIVGPSGSGKSTLLDIIAGLKIPSGGSVYLGDLRLSGDVLNQWWSQIAYVEQDFGILSGTIRENVTIGRPEASVPEVQEALDRVGLGGYACLGTAGLERLVDAQGVGLSGGESQRIGIARAMISRRPVILLDEPSSNLDYLNFMDLVHVLAGLKVDHVLIVVTHDERFMSIADRVIQVGSGSFSE